MMDFVQSRAQIIFPPTFQGNFGPDLLKLLEVRFMGHSSLQQIYMKLFHAHAEVLKFLERK